VWSTELGSPESLGTNWSATDGGPDLHEIPGGGVTHVIFGATGNSAGALSTTLGADFSINSLTFASTRTNPVVIGGANSLTILLGGITIDSGSGADTINATGNGMTGTPGVVLGASQRWTNNSANVFTVQSVIGDAGAGNALTITGSGVTEFDGVNTYSGGTNVSAGTLVIGVNGALPDGSLAITGGTVQLAQNTGLAQATSLTISGNGTLDITNNHMIITYAAGTQAATDLAIRGYLVSGYAGGNWNGVNGIDSSVAAVTSGFGVGYADGADGVVAGLSSGQIELKYTRYGDANLDGVVSGVDFTILVGNLGKSANSWDQGDFNYDGVVSGVDFTLLVGNLGKAANGADITLPAADLAAIDAFAAANGLMADVPEPATAGLMILGGIAALGKRRRRA
jgi:autotransporter-associated beta strand protein